MADEVPRLRRVEPWRRHLGGVVIELVIVFIGVYAAFALSAADSERQAESRRRQLIEAISEEIHQYAEGTRELAPVLERTAAMWDSAYAAGAMPRPHPMRGPAKVTPFIWNATQQSGALTLLPVKTFASVAGFYNEIESGFVVLERMRAQCDQQVVPLASQPTQVFYDATTHKLRPQFEWYPEELHTLARLARAITTDGDAHVAELAREAGGHAR